MINEYNECTSYVELIEELKNIEVRAEMIRERIRNIKKGILMDSEIKKLMEDACAFMGVSVSEILSHTRKESVCIPRHILRYVMRTRGLNLSTIAEFTSTSNYKTNHTTIIHSIETVTNALYINCPKFMKYYRAVSQLVDNQLVESIKC